MSKPDEGRFSTMGEVYDRMAPLLVPGYGDLQNEALLIPSLEATTKPVVVDLGAGSGRLLEKALEQFPKAECYWVDSSEDFLRVAKRRLARFGDSVTFVLSALEDRWEDHVQAPPNFIVSMSAIHHLESEEKRALYRRCYELLADGGWFVNIDEMKTVCAEAYEDSLRYWVAHVAKAEASISEEDRGCYEQWNHHFENWKRRNLENIHEPKTKGDDLHESFLDQLTWLQETGFRHVDLFVKYYLWCGIGGQKP